MLVKNWMTRNVIAIDVDDSMQHAIYRMQDHKIRLLPVMSGGRLVGIISDRDLKRASPSDATTLDMHEMLYLTSRIRIKDLMVENPVTVPPDYTIEEAAQLLLEHRISGLPVTDSKGNVAGIVTRSDIFRALISIAALGKKGIQVAIRVEDRPGPIKKVREIVGSHNARTASILSTAENAPEGFLNVYFRVYDLAREKAPALIEEIGRIGTVLYVVDHRNNRRVVYEEA